MTRAARFFRRSGHGERLRASRQRRVALSVALTITTVAGCLTRAGTTGAPQPRASQPGASLSAAAAPAPSPRPAGFALAITGDLLIHEPIVDKARQWANGAGYDFRPAFAAVKPILSAADLAICHLETPLSRDDSDISYYPTFNVPHEIAPAAADAGFRSCTTASNHTIDKGLAGVQATLNALDAAGIAHVGAARSAEEAATPKIYDLGGVRVGHLDYTYGLNGQRLPASAPWIVKLIDPAQILADAKAVRAAGAQFVLVSMHWGEEYQAAPTAQQRSIAQQLLASPDIDLVVGNHVHVVQPVERIGPKYVVYGDGNFLARHAPCCDTPQTRDGMIVQVTVEVQNGTPAVSRLGYSPTYVDPATVTILPVARTLWDPHLSPALRNDLEQSWQRTTATVDMLGAAAAGVVPTEQP